MKKRPFLILHRANSIQRIKKALEIGADGVEIDVRKTKDNILVVSHNRRIKDGNAVYHWIDKHTYNELTDLNGFSMLTLEESLSAVYFLVKRKRITHKIIIDLDLKDNKSGAFTAACLNKFPKLVSIGTVLAGSPDIWTLKDFADYFPKAKIGLSMVFNDRFDGEAVRLLRYGVVVFQIIVSPIAFRIIRRKTSRKNIAMINLHYRNVNNKIVQYSILNKLAINVFSVKKIGVYRRLLTYKNINSVKITSLPLLENIIQAKL
jgi:glycerophosphoryl diester phosphodiesterase